MWEFFNKVVQGRRIPRPDDSGVPSTTATIPVNSHYQFERPHDLLETISAKRQVYQRLNKHKGQQLTTIGESIADRAEFERKLNQYLRKRNQSEVMSIPKKRRYITPEQRRQAHSLAEEEVMSRKVSAPAWMKNPKRLLGLPSIQVKYGPHEDHQNRLDNLTISIEPIPLERKRPHHRRAPSSFFKN